ncbi:MAG: tol-pal system protein YbgF [Alphaproteobacteria bacterium]|jgi:tol-pal system protein YbgF|nr:tol-pal system protein YbgF [Rhodospirillaceae bacterium]MDG2481274.1 tol-pal system protein YbgF [Alphaproteobacteria bacterium]MBT6205044.1 tol-pal system protein YbgF [Rhodospirillaceae bacterium]MBT6511802.1 tol-pal system protein YbgF [Rhodospirillaceae bacterium]MBT7614575.1 tol-pal system protein YbgF [Rhodospirillaceae bacterium]
MRKLSVLLLTSACLFVSAPALAQSTDVQSLAHEMERLRNDLVDLQRFVYAGEGEALVVSPGLESSQDAAQFQLSLQQVEERVRLLTGRVEELEYQQRQLLARMDTLIADLERGAAVPSTGELVMSEDTVTADDGGAVDIVPNTTETTAGVAGAILPPGSEMDQYNFAFSLLRKADYEGAQMAFDEFITLHPDSELTGNAYYWLGSTHFVRDQYRDAAVAFLKGYQEGPTGPKAADNLLKLGVTLSRLGKPDEACATFKELSNKFPEAAQILLDEASDEAASAGCS